MMAPTVALTFDFDAISLWMARGMTTPGPVSRGEFAAHAIPRILDLLAEYDVTSTFFIPGHTIETYPNEVRAIADAGHEIGAHGYAHEPVSTLDLETERRVLERSVRIIREATGRAPRGYRTPSFDFTPHTVGLLEEAGFVYDSSLMGTDTTPYFARSGDSCPDGSAFEFGAESEILEIPVSWTLDDYPHLEFVRAPGYVMPGLQSARTMFDSFFEDVQYMVDTDPDGVCTVTLHPEAIGRGARMRALESFIQRVRTAGAEFATLERVANVELEQRVIGRRR